MFIRHHNVIQLVVGSEDFDLRIFDDTDLLNEFSENEVAFSFHNYGIHVQQHVFQAVTALCGMGSRSFAYAQNNGGIGMYASTQKKWTKKVQLIYGNIKYCVLLRTDFLFSYQHNNFSSSKPRHVLQPMTLILTASTSLCAAGGTEKSTSDQSGLVHSDWRNII